ncbi:NAD-dependent epimerase/dehydratase family protein [Gynuella sunshinyii]|uniref:Nucleoside-diphosphate-sugar epimerase n=1 Tax=Gynuella sunshinyii YC6258 TaxID=1445510 RepID=A0A0C5W5U9_9GAMM|nr:NAD-dependent epimerase/dehydratase family protein [Gynuella sunshinyii]AJQ97979.1 nucleoside-diphosphate-sugar epimerase [Gynuella sunshinyii YC6258]
MQTSSTVLILGATGGIGGEAARQLAAAGWTVRAMSRRSKMASEHDHGIAWVHGDAMNRHDVDVAAQGCEVILHAVNPPGYKNWQTLVLPMLENTIAAAQKHGAMIVLPGTVYNYGPDAFPLLTEETPQNPLTRKGLIRRQMEQRLREFADDGGRVLIVRAGDFFGPVAGNNWFSQSMIKVGRRVTSVTIPGQPGVGHQWAFLPDVARTMVQLLERRQQLDPFATFHMGGHWDDDGLKLAEAVCRVVKRHTGTAPKMTRFPWWLIRLLAPFQQTLREILEMRYLWRQPVQLSHQRLTALLGEEPHTPLDQAVEETLRGLGCLN